MKPATLVFDETTTLAGAMSTGELGISLAQMIRAGKVHAITCTAANLEEDVFNLVAHDEYRIIENWRAGSPVVDVRVASFAVWEQVFDNLAIGGSNDLAATKNDKGRIWNHAWAGPSLADRCSPELTTRLWVQRNAILRVDDEFSSAKNR